MNIGDNWLTLSEIIYQSSLNDIEARRMINKLGESLSPRNFGDIVKYPAPVADLLGHFLSLSRQGWTIEDLKNLLTRTRQEIQAEGQARKSNLLAEQQQESATLVQDLEFVMSLRSHMQEVLRSMAHLMASFDSLIGCMLDQEKEISGLLND
jgi:hypothetical protein